MAGEAADAPKAPNHLKVWRKRAGLTQAQVEKILGWQHARVSHLERGEATITEHVLQSLAPLYGCEPADLLGPALRVERESGRTVEALAILRETEQNLQRLMTEFQAVKDRLTPLLAEFAKQMVDLNEAAIKASRCAVETGGALTQAASLLSGPAAAKRRE